MVDAITSTTFSSSATVYESLVIVTVTSLQSVPKEVLSNQELNPVPVEIAASDVVPATREKVPDPLLAFECILKTTPVITVPSKPLKVSV